jgi:hypothetical protein
MRFDPGTVLLILVAAVLFVVVLILFGVGIDAR